jgi:hypothetical protein
MDTSMDNMEHSTKQWVEFELKKEGATLDDADKKKEVALFGDSLNELKLTFLGALVYLPQLLKISCKGCTPQSHCFTYSFA